VSLSANKEMFNLVTYIDGGLLGNPGPAGIGVVIDGAENGTIKIPSPLGARIIMLPSIWRYSRHPQCAVDLGAKALHVFSDSEVVVKQMTGEYSCRSAQLYSLNWTCRKLARSLDFSISHVTRENNAEANRLANAAARKASRMRLSPAGTSVARD